MLTRKFLGVEVVNDKEVGKLGIFAGGQVKYIKTWRPKKNYILPRYHLFAGGDFSVPLTLETCKNLLLEFDLIPVDTKYLVNPRQVEDIVQKKFSSVAVAKFSGAKEIPVSKNRINIAMARELPLIPRDLVFVGVKVDESGFEMTQGCGTFSLADLCYIDTYEFKSNYKVPRFHTTKGIFTIVQKMETCIELFPEFIKMDSGLLVNFQYVDDVKENKHGALEVLFKDDTSVDIPEAKRNIAYDILRNGLAYN